MTRERAGAHVGTYALGMDDETVTLHLTKAEAFALSVALRMSGVLLVSRRHSLEAVEEEFPAKVGGVGLHGPACALSPGAGAHGEAAAGGRGPVSDADPERCPECGGCELCRRCELSEWRDSVREITPESLRVYGDHPQ